MEMAKAMEQLLIRAAKMLEIREKIKDVADGRQAFWFQFWFA